MDASRVVLEAAPIPLCGRLLECLYSCLSDRALPHVGVSLLTYSTSSMPLPFHGESRTNSGNIESRFNHRESSAGSAQLRQVCAMSAFDLAVESRKTKLNTSGTLNALCTIVLLVSEPNVRVANQLSTYRRVGYLGSRRVRLSSFCRAMLRVL